MLILAVVAVLLILLALSIVLVYTGSSHGNVNL